jgi:hypothetical protein
VNVVVLLAGAALLAVAPVELVPLAPKRVRHCEKSPLLRPACPRLVPRVRATYLAHLSRRSGQQGADVFNLERGGEDPRHPERNRPPRMAHVVIAAGEVGHVAPVWSLGTRRAQLRNGLMRRTRAHTLRLGRVRWAGKSGRLYLAPRYPKGGVLGNHLVFRWGLRGREYVVSLHAWEPLLEAVATMRAVVASIPRR